jgi:signal transduction histidine kinase
VRAPRLTIRGRLTAVYGGLFLLGGLALLVATYALVSRELRPDGKLATTFSPAPGAAGLAGGPPGTRPGDPGGVLIRQVADSTRDSALHTLVTQGPIALAVVAALAAVFGWLLAGRLLQPLARVTSTARRIADAPAADRGLHERIALGGPRDELKELADTFDLMLARLDQSFESQRRFIANASHELRTPLTLNRTLIEVALEPADASPRVRQLGATLLAINARHGQLIDGLLLLARSERDIETRSYVDLADIVEHVLAGAGAGTGGGTVRLRAETHEAPTAGDPVLLERLVQNLVDNGVRHNVPDGGWVEAATGSQGSACWVRVSNTGPVIPRYEVPGLFEPFRRYGADRVSTHGAGLGLSIVRAVAQAHGGQVRAEPRAGGGLIVTVTLPTVT